MKCESEYAFWNILFHEIGRILLHGKKEMRQCQFFDTASFL